MPRCLLRESLGGETPQFIVDLWQELPRGLAIALGDGVHDLRELAHGVPAPVAERTFDLDKYSARVIHSGTVDKLPHSAQFAGIT